MSRILSRLLAAVLGLVAGAAFAEPDGPTEYEAKAAFLYNFTKFVEWPAAAFAAANSPLQICVLGDDPFGPELDAVSSRQAQGRPLTVRRPATAEAATGCHLLFVAASEQRRLAAVQAALRGRPVLLVGDMSGFAEQGGAINLVFEAQRVRMEINPEAAQARGLRISSQVLRLARIVRSGP